MLVALSIAMLRLREAGSSQDLHVSIIHEVVLRYANMNYLTSRPASPSPPSPLSISVHSPLYSYTFSQNLSRLSEQHLFLGTVFAE